MDKPEGAGTANGHLGTTCSDGSLSTAPVHVCPSPPLLPGVVVKPARPPANDGLRVKFECLSNL